MNLLLNPELSFHCFDNSRSGLAPSFRSGSMACWDQEAYGDAEAYRAPRVNVFRPRFTVDNVAVIHAGKRLYQFSLLAEMGLDHGDHVSLSLFGHQPAADCLRVAIHLMRLDSASGEWSPATYGQDDRRTFPKLSRGELIKGPSYAAASGSSEDFELRIENAEIAGAFTESPDRGTDQLHTIGILVELTNTSKNQDVWVYSPCLNKGSAPVNRLPVSRAMPTYYRGIPRTIQKLWRGDPLHIMVMGSSIDRGSANPPQYLYDENPQSPTFKQPLTWRDFDGARVGHPEWNDYIAWWQHYFMYGGRLRLALMRKFNYPIQKLLLNTMACDGSSISEAHSGFADYASLSLPPDPDLNGHRRGKTWRELYPEVFTRPEGPRPDLVVFGSGANEKVDGADEIALFEGAIRWFQRNYPDTEFLFCMFQNRESYTPNTGHLMELSLRYQIPYIDFGRVFDLATRHCNSYALVPRDGHPQASGHYIWSKQLERAFDVADPIESGIAQRQLPERISPYTLGWEGDVHTYQGADPRIHGGTAFILDDTVVNLWATSKEKGGTVEVKVDGSPHSGSRRVSMVGRDLRNSTFATGRLSLGDRHIVEVTGSEAKLVAVDSKVVPNRQWIGVESRRWRLADLKPQAFLSQWGAPFGTMQVVLAAGQSVDIDVPGTDFSVSYVDQANGGEMRVEVDGREVLHQETNVPVKIAGAEPLYFENRKGLLHFAYGLHTVRVTAGKGAVTLLGIFSYDTRSNRDHERVLRGTGYPGETIEFAPVFKARPLVSCTGKLEVTSPDVTLTGMKLSGGGEGAYEVVGE